MEFIYGKQDFKTLERGEENCYLMTNGLGGFSALSMIGSCNRNDHAVLMSCEAAEAPNHRYNMIHRLEEILVLGEREIHLSSQKFTDGTEEDGYHYLSSFSYESYPQWIFQAEGVELTKKLFLMPGENTVGICYELENRSGKEAVFKVLPHLQFVPKGEKLSPDRKFEVTAEVETTGVCGGAVKSAGRSLYCSTDGEFSILPATYCDKYYYDYDFCNGRTESGATQVNHALIFRAAPGERRRYSTVYSTQPVKLPGVTAGQDCERQVERAVEQMESAMLENKRVLLERAGLRDETAGCLVLAADQFISYRASTGKQTILAGFPFFEDWGRDTMISLTGCCLSTRQFSTAKNILRTFMMYEDKGLMPNLFPEGKQEPRYNTVDAALLFILAVYEYYVRTEDKDFVAEAYPVMQDIVAHYAMGTDFGIGMDEDGLIHAGEGFDQVTWMDVRVGDILPTPRHGKPVEINAYWYNALCIMDYFRNLCKETALSDKRDYKKMAETAGESFRAKFWNEDKKCLRDVISSNAADEGITGENVMSGESHRQIPDEQIRCNQIWAVSLPFSLLDREQEKQVVETVFRELYTPLGLRTLAPEDPEFKPFYGGELLQRDLAYHQGTVWTFPLGGYYLAYLKVNDYSEEAKKKVREQLKATEAALREGCIGQLPEIYDGLEPTSSKGCFAQAWSVGELLRVYEALER